MPKRTTLIIDDKPYQYKSKQLQMKKSYTTPNFQSSTIFTDDAFTFVEFYFASHSKTMKYNDPALKSKYGDEKKYHYSFYWNQAKTFYKAAKELPIESVPLLSYYSMLNATKAFLAYRCKYIDDFVKDFGTHGLREDNTLAGKDLSTIAVYRQQKGVFALFGKTLEKDFDTIWPKGDTNKISLKRLLYNLAYIHRAYMTTYDSKKGPRIPELFIPVKMTEVPCYYKGNDTNLYMQFEVQKDFFGVLPSAIPTAYVSSVSPKFVVSETDNFVIRSKEGAKRNGTDSLTTEFKSLNDSLRREFQYIRSSNKLWYLKRNNLLGGDVVNLNSMLITMATMHRLSEIVRYKPEQMAHLMNSKENWLIHEFLTLSLDQFIDELVAEITGQDIMSSGIIE